MSNFRDNPCSVYSPEMFTGMGTFSVSYQILEVQVRVHIAGARVQMSVLNYNTDDNLTLEARDLDFFMQYTRGGPWPEVEEAKELVRRVWLAVKAKYHTYRCIQSLSFLKPKVQNLEAYSKLLDVYREQGKVKVMDLGCCFGQETRKLIVDGIPPEMIWAVDVIDGYWTAGKELFNDQEDSKHRIEHVHTVFADPCAADVDGDISRVLTADFDCVILMYVFHVLSLHQSEMLVQRMNLMLRKGGLVMGTCVGSTKAQEWQLTPDGKSARFLHSIGSLSELFMRCGFEDVVVKERDWEEGLGGPDSRWPEEEGVHRQRLEFRATKI